MTKRAPTKNTFEDDWENMPSGRSPGRRGHGRTTASLRAAVSAALRGQRMGSASRRASIETRAPGASSRRVIVKLRVVQVGSAYGKKAAQLHQSYIEREGVELDGSKGVLYGPQGPAEPATLGEELPGERHQFRVIVSPEDARELDLTEFVRSYMHRIEQDLGRELRWAAVNHFNTDNPHAHIVIRGVDADGREVRMDREYVSNGLRNRAQELATEELGPRPGQSRRVQLEREAELERYTALDRALELRAEDGRVRLGTAARGRQGRFHDPEKDAALGRRLELLGRLGLAEREGPGHWRLSPGLRKEMDHMQRRAEGLRRIVEAVRVDPSQARIIDREEAKEGIREELERGVQGAVRWKGLDEQGRFCAVIETVGGAAYYMPVNDRVAVELKVGQVIDLKKALDKDQRIEAAAQKNGRVYDLNTLPVQYRDVFEKRLLQLERMGLATAETRGRWKLEENFIEAAGKGRKVQAYWQMLSIHRQAQGLADQAEYPGHVWLDRVNLDAVGVVGFGREVRAMAERRDRYLGSLGLDPKSRNLRWKLRDVQRDRLERAIAAQTGRSADTSGQLREGRAKVHQQPNGERFIEVSAGQRFVVHAAPRGAEAFDGLTVRVGLDDRGRAAFTALDKDQGRQR